MLLTLSILVVLVTSFLCSLSEASLLSVSRVRLHALGEKSASARLVSRMKETMDRPIAAILILNTVANTGGAAIAGREYERAFGGAHIGIFTVLFTLAVLILAELVPKTLGVRHSVQASLILARPLYALISLLRPLTWGVERVSMLLGGRTSKGLTFSVEDLRAMARLAVSSKVLGREESMIIEAASRLPRINVGQLMIHREDIVFLSLAREDEVNLRAAQQSMHSRLLLCHRDLEDLVGFVNVKEVLWRLVQQPEDRKEEGLKRILGEAVREPVFVAPELEVPALLQLFSREHEHLAVVRDGAGKVVGMVTLEDVVEELIGEIDDEYDSSPHQVEQLGAGLWRFGGGTAWTEAARTLGIRGEAVRPENLDLDGRFDMHDLAADRLRGKLRTGGVFTVGPWRFKVTRMRRGKVLHVEAMLLGQGAPRPSTRPAPTTSPSG